jgi:hypothetical protein
VPEALIKEPPPEAESSAKMYPLNTAQSERSVVKEIAVHWADRLPERKTKSESPFHYSHSSLDKIWMLVM